MLSVTDAVVYTALFLFPPGINSYMTGFGQEFASLEADAFRLQQAVHSHEVEAKQSGRKLDQFRLHVEAHLNLVCAR